jgi:N-acetylglucosaminyldiphosphoundecaprenol N-acetyl-beta-D-mannosaminyltransferase
MIGSGIDSLNTVLTNGQAKAIHLVNSFTVTKLAEINKIDILYSEYCIADGKYLSIFYKLVRNNILYFRGSEFFDYVLTEYPNSKHLILGTPSIGVENFLNIVKSKYPKNHLVQVYSPPFSDEFQVHLDFSSFAIKESSPDFIWVAIGTPKQDLLVSELAKVHHGQFVAIGAAINFLGQKESPVFLQILGLEWLYRLFKEPRRLWRRYLLDGPKFVYVLILNIYK